MQACVVWVIECAGLCGMGYRVCRLVESFTHHYIAVMSMMSAVSMARSMALLVIWNMALLQMSYDRGPHVTAHDRSLEYFSPPFRLGLLDFK